MIMETVFPTTRDIFRQNGELKNNDNSRDQMHLRKGGDKYVNSMKMFMSKVAEFRDSL